MCEIFKLMLGKISSSVTGSFCAHLCHTFETLLLNHPGWWKVTPRSSGACRLRHLSFTEILMNLTRCHQRKANSNANFIREYSWNSSMAHFKTYIPSALLTVKVIMDTCFNFLRSSSSWTCWD